LRTTYGRRNRAGYDRARIFRLDVGKIKSPQHQLLILRAPRLVSNDNGASINSLEEQRFLEKNQIEGLGRRLLIVLAGLAQERPTGRRNGCTRDHD